MENDATGLPMELTMDTLPLSRAFTLLEPGPLVLITTHDGRRNNVMPLSWSMVLDFSASFAITTGPWNHSFTALDKTRECVIAIPTVDMIDTAIAAGICSGADTDKFATLPLTPLKASHVRAPLIRECLANIECRVVDMIERHNIIVLEGIAAWIDPDRTEQRTIHAVGDGTFVVDGQRIDRREMMRSKLPDGI